MIPRYPDTQMFQTLVQNIISKRLNRGKISHKKRMENQHIKDFFPYVRNMHLMKKDELEKFLLSLSTYAPDHAINGKQIHPDDEQMAVINAHPDFHLRVLAGAGTGKTTTICCRSKINRSRNSSKKYTDVDIQCGSMCKYETTD